jgi:hypothetical protein
MGGKNRGGETIDSHYMIQRQVLKDNHIDFCVRNFKAAQTKKQYLQENFRLNRGSTKP